MKALCTVAFTSLFWAFTLCAGTRSRRSPSDKRIAAVLAGSRGPSTAMSLCRQTLQTKQECPSTSRSLCSQWIALMYSSTWQGWSYLHQQDR